MKRALIALFTIASVCLLMTFFVANIAEKEIKELFSQQENTDISVELLDYQRNFFSATAVTMLTIKDDINSDLLLKITSTVHHYPYQASIKSTIELQDETLAQKAEHYFGTPQWIISEEKISLFSKLTGKLMILAGSYESESESWSTEPLLLDYEMDLKQKSGDFNLSWAGMTGIEQKQIIKLKSLSVSSHFSQLIKENDYNYLLNVASVNIQENDEKSLFEGISLEGRSQQGTQKETIDTSNELIIKTYQINENNKETFTDNHIKLSLTGLYQPALKLLSEGVSDTHEIENALSELVHHGAQLTLSQLTSQTPWGEVDGNLDLTLDKGASLTNIMINPYILFDHMSGDASLVLPLGLLEEPEIAEPLKVGLASGLLVRGEQTINLQTSFQQGELKVNGKVIPL